MLDGFRLNLLTVQSLLKLSFRLAASLIVRNSTAELSELMAQQIIELASMVTDGETITGLQPNLSLSLSTNGDNEELTQDQIHSSGSGRNPDRDVITKDAGKLTGSCV
jgi:hypothetical protein